MGGAQRRRPRKDRPTLAAGLSDRAEEMWTPILAIFDRARSAWANAARAAATALSGSTNLPDDDISIELLRDIRTEWPGDEPFIPTKALLEKLHVLDERPWGEWRRGQPMSERAFALRLKLFGIYSRSNGHVRGYDRDSFSDAWVRYGIGSEASKRQGVNEGGAAAIDTLTGDTGAGGKAVKPRGKKEWTVDELEAGRQNLLRSAQGR